MKGPLSLGNRIRDYFDLGKGRPGPGIWKSPEAVRLAKARLVKAFMAPGGVGPTVSESQGKGKKTGMMPWGEQILMYLGILVGVVFSSAIQQYMADRPFDFSLPLFRLILSAVVAWLLMPYVYKNMDVAPDTPLLIRCGLFVQNGVFCQVIFGAIGKQFG